MNYPNLHPVKFVAPINNVETKPAPKLKLVNFVSQSYQTQERIEHNEDGSKGFHCNNTLETETKDLPLKIQDHSKCGIDTENKKIYPEKQSTAYLEDTNNQKLKEISSRVIKFINLVPETVAQVRKIDDSFSQEAEDEKPLFNLKNLETTLVNIFKADQLQLSDFQLSTPELHILFEILMRKYKSSPNCR